MHAWAGRGAEGSVLLLVHATGHEDLAVGGERLICGSHLFIKCIWETFFLCFCLVYLLLKEFDRCRLLSTRRIRLEVLNKIWSAR